MTQYGRLPTRPGSKVIGEQVAKPAHEAGFSIIQNGYWEREEINEQVIIQEQGNLLDSDDWFSGNDAANGRLTGQ
jgi:hypothetical protein